MGIKGIKSKVPYPNVCEVGVFPSLKPDRMNEDPVCKEDPICKEDPVCKEDEQHQKLHRLFTGHTLIGFLITCTPEKKFNRKRNTMTSHVQTSTAIGVAKPYSFTEKKEPLCEKS